MKRTSLALAIAGALMLAGCSGEVAEIVQAIRSPGGTPIRGLPTGHLLTSRILPAGNTITIGETGGVRTTLTCPAGGANCNITVFADGSATSTGGIPAVATVRIPDGGSGGGGEPTVSRSEWESIFTSTGWACGNQDPIPASQCGTFRSLNNAPQWTPSDAGTTPLRASWEGGSVVGLITTPDGRRNPFGSPSLDTSTISLDLTHNNQTGYFIRGSIRVEQVIGPFSRQPLVIELHPSAIETNGTWGGDPNARGKSSSTRHSHRYTDGTAFVPEWGGALYGSGRPVASRGWVAGRQDFSGYPGASPAYYTGDISATWAVTASDLE